MMNKPEATPEQREMQLQAEYYRGQVDGLGFAKRLLLEAAGAAFTDGEDGEARLLRDHANRVGSEEKDAEKAYRRCLDET